MTDPLCPQVLLTQIQALEGRLLRLEQQHEALYEYVIHMEQESLRFRAAMHEGHQRIAHYTDRTTEERRKMRFLPQRKRGRE